MQSEAGQMDVVIVNWNAGGQLRDCVQSLLQAVTVARRIASIVIVDNASTDASLEPVLQMGPAVRVIANAANRGFAAACNQGADIGRADYILFLNPDTTVSADSLETPAAFLDDAANEGYAACGIMLRDDAAEVARHCARFPRPADFFGRLTGLDRLLPRWFPGFILGSDEHRTSRDVDHVIGAFYSVRRSVFSALGGFDERFYVYLEDLDLSLRIRRAGWKIRYLAEVSAGHRGGGTSERAMAHRLFYSVRSRVLYGYKHFGRLAGTALLLASLTLEPVARLLLAAGHRSLAEVCHTMRAFAMLAAWAPSLLVPGAGGGRR